MGPGDIKLKLIKNNSGNVTNFSSHYRLSTNKNFILNFLWEMGDWKDSWRMHSNTRGIEDTINCCCHIQQHFICQIHYFQDSSNYEENLKICLHLSLNPTSQNHIFFLYSSSSFLSTFLPPEIHNYNYDFLLSGTWDKHIRSRFECSCSFHQS